MAPGEGSRAGEDDWLAAAASGGARANALPSSRPTQASAGKSLLERRPGGWMAAALASKGSDIEGEERAAKEPFQGDGGKHVAVETASVGVQWEEDGGDAARAPSLSTTGGLPPWAKPYACSPSPPTEAIGDDGSKSEACERVTMESSGIQCGESVLGG